MSESFANDSTTQAATFYSNGSATTGRAAGPATLSISYDATTQGYTIVTAGRSQTFLPSDVDASQSSAQVKVYSKTSGALTESLSLTQPGTSGRLTYQYVGAGFWQRATSGSTTLSTTFDSFTYGVVTLASALPRSGSGTFAVDLIGAMSAGVPSALSGDGVVQVDFAAGTFGANGTLRETSLATGALVSSSAFASAGTLSSSANSFAGNFGFYNGGQFTGTINGRFYGPAAQEIGAAWSATQSDGRVASGALIGRNDPTATGFNLALTNLRYDQSFAGPQGAVTYTDGGGATSPAIAAATATLAYNASAQSYTYADPSGTDTAYTSADKVASESTASIDVYKHVRGDGTTTLLMLYKPGSGNTQLALSYASFGHWQSIGTAGTGGARARADRYFVWGEKTDPNLLPRSGTGHFDGIVTATGVDAANAAYDITGTSSFDVNFGGSSFTGALTMTGQSRATSASTSIGTFGLTGGTIGGDATLSANFSGGTGAFSGQFYGSNATELGGTFTLQTTGAPVTSIAGATVAKRNP